MKNISSTGWIHCISDPVYKNARFKRIEGTPSHYESLLEVVPIVSMSEFIAIQDNCFPLFVSTQFRIFPKPEEVFKDDQPRTVAMFGISLLSGSVMGLTLCAFRGPDFIIPVHTVRFPKQIRSAS